MKVDDEDMLPTIRRLMVISAGPALTSMICLLTPKLVLAEFCPKNVGQVILTSNLSILMINMIPVLPLDGGRLLALMLSLFIPRKLVRRLMKKTGLIVGLGMVCLNIYVTWRLACISFSLAAIGCCIMYCSSVAAETYALSELRRYMDRKIKLEKRSFAKTVTYAVMHTQPMWKLIQLLPENKVAAYICLEAGSMRCLGGITEFDLIQAYLKSPDGTIADTLKYSKNENMSKIAQSEKDQLQNALTTGKSS